MFNKIDALEILNFLAGSRDVLQVLVNANSFGFSCKYKTVSFSMKEGNAGINFVEIIASDTDLECFTMVFSNKKAVETDGEPDLFNTKVIARIPDVDRSELRDTFENETGFLLSI